MARKSTEAGRGIEQIAGMGLMGLGGLVSIVGGVLFLVLVLRAMARGRARAGAGQVADGR